MDNADVCGEQPTPTIELHEIDADWLAVLTKGQIAYAFVAARREAFAGKLFRGEPHLAIERDRVNQFKASAAARGVYVELV
jgi:hypothetical protein